MYFIVHLLVAIVNRRVLYSLHLMELVYVFIKLYSTHEHYLLVHPRNNKHSLW